VGGSDPDAVTCSGLDSDDVGACPDVAAATDRVSPRRESRRLRGDRGETIQAIVVMPVLLVMVLLVVQAGLALHARQVMSASAQDGAASGAALDSTPGAGQAITDQLVTSTVGGLVDNYSSNVSVSATQVTITATAQAKKVFPLFPTINLSASGSATIEQFDPQGP